MGELRNLGATQQVALLFVVLLLLGSSTMDTARLRVFLGEHYRSVIEHTCEEALAKSFGSMPQASSAAKS